MVTKSHESPNNRPYLGFVWVPDSLGWAEPKAMIWPNL